MKKRSPGRNASRAIPVASIGFGLSVGAEASARGVGVAATSAAYDAVHPRDNSTTFSDAAVGFVSEYASLGTFDLRGTWRRRRRHLGKEGASNKSHGKSKVSFPT